MRATKMFVTAPGLPVRQHLQGICVEAGSMPWSQLLESRDGGTLQTEWYPHTETWIVFAK